MATKKPASDQQNTTIVNNTTVVVNAGNGTAVPPKPRRKKKQSPTTQLKRKIAKVTGIPTTASGRKKKAERVIAGFLSDQLDKLDKK